MKISSLHIDKHKRRPHIFGHKADFNVVHAKSLDMADKKAVRGHLTEHYRLGVIFFLFRRDERSLLAGSAAFIVDTDIAQVQVLDVIAGNAADDRRVFCFGVISDDVADDDPSELALGHRFLWATVPFSEANENWRIHDIAHRDIRDRHIFEEPTIDGFEREATRVLENDVRDRDVLKSTVRLSSEFYAAGRAVVAVSLVIALVGSVEECSFVVPADLRVCYGHIFGSPSESE